MLHNSEDHAAATATTTNTITTTITTISMADNETTANGTEPRIATHFATATTTATESQPLPQSTAAEEVNVDVDVAAEGQSLTANNALLSLSTLTLTSTSALPLSAVPESPELATAVAVVAAAASPASSPTSSELLHVASEPAFGIQMRTQQQRKIKNYHDNKQSAVWRTDSLASNPSPSNSFNKSGGGGGAAATAPCLLQRKASDSSVTSSSMPRRVSFPAGDKELVTGYLEPANPWEQVCQVNSIAEIAELYVQSCQKHRTQPLQNIMDHLKTLDLHVARQPQLSLKALQLTPNDCEPLEEIFKRIQYKAIDLSECPLNESCLSALFQMIEYYEAANELDISYNKEPMTQRSWMLCTYMVGRSQQLQVLNAAGNPISKQGADSLGCALTTSNLHTLKLEHCGLRGPPLTSLCCQLYHNKLLKELWLGYNDLDCTDAQHIADMLRFNHCIELIDISNNNVRDEGAMYLVQALIMQSAELERRSGAPLQRARAIEDDECVSPSELESATPTPMPTPKSEQVEAPASPTESSDVSLANDQQVEQRIESPTEAALAAAAVATAHLESVENDGDEDNTEDTVRTVRGCAGQGTAGQSMLDKLLSMNSDSSSEEAPSNLSTDTLAACCSEDISEDIFDANTKTSMAAAAAAKTTASDVATATSSAPLEPKPESEQPSTQTERNLCDITPSTEAKTVEPNVQNHNNHNNHHQHNNNHNNNNNNHMAAEANVASNIYEVIAEESDCINGAGGRGGGGATASGSRPLDVNKNAKTTADDFEDTHSTDSAFESASEGDISRHLPDEFSRLSVSLESTRLDDLAKEMTIETATIATESTECLALSEEATVVAPTPKAAELLPPPLKVTIAAGAQLIPSPCGSPTPTPPPPSTSPGGAGGGLRRTETSCAYLNQSSRNRSQSSDSLCSDISLDGSISADHQFAEKLTKNDTLSRRQLVDATAEAANRAPSGLKALTLWSNNLTKNCAPCIAELLQRTVSLELLNIGKNCLSNDFVASIKDSLTKNTTLTTLGLQSAHLSAKGIETLASIMTFGGNSKLQRIDIRDNKLEVESLNIIAEVLKSNKTITQIDINDEPKRLTLPIVPIVNVIPPTPLPQESIGSDAHLDYTRVLGTVRSMCSRNEKLQQAQLLADRTAIVGGGSASGGGCSSGNVGINRCRGGYYLGSRKISLTCHSRPLVDAATGTVSGTLAVTSVTPTPAAKLEVRRKSNARLRSPGPSPPTISPSSSPNRSSGGSSRFHVSRVNEISPLTSPPPPAPRSASSCVSIPTASSPSSLIANSNGGMLPTSSSLPAMASVSSSTQTIKRLSMSPRSRFHVSRIYEDPQVPLTSRQMPPITITTPHTPPINLPPTPMLKSARKAAQLAAELTNVVIVETNVVIVEPSKEEAHPLISTKLEQAQKLSPHLSHSPPSCSSCSTSPVSLNSSSSPSSSSTSSTSTSSGGCNDATDSSCASSVSQAAPKSCPIAVFGDNDITLTKESAAVVALSINPEPAATVPVTEAVNLQPATRARKTSWIANPSAVDKLLTLFNTGTIFQRSSSPESKPQPVINASAPNTNDAQITNTTTTTLPTAGGAGDANAASLVLAPTRKTTPPAWTLNNSNSNGNGNANANATPLEAGSSFLDNASRQLRDFGKQVFRQNLSFNNSADGSSSNNAMEASGTGSGAGTGGATSPISAEMTCASMAELSAAHIPLNLKRELKENISPEHTINEETLHTLQKLARVEEVTLKAEAAAELGDIEIVMHSELADCPAEQQQQQQQAAENPQEEEAPPV